MLCSRSTAIPLYLPPHPTPPRDTTGFNNVRTWLADVREHADPHLTCILVGNKRDLLDPPTLKPRQVPTEEAAQYAREQGLLFVEASAKSGHNVDRAFEDASRDILDKIQRGVFDDDRVGPSFPLLPFSLCSPRAQRASTCSRQA